jgi:hypothetical protein
MQATTEKCYCSEGLAAMGDACHICKEEFNAWSAALDAQPAAAEKEAA